MWAKGAVFTTDACVGQSFISAAVFICGTEVQYLQQLHVWDRVLLVQMFHTVCGTEVQFLQQLLVRDRVFIGAAVACV